MLRKKFSYLESFFDCDCRTAFPARPLGSQIREARENGVSEAIIAPPCFDDGVDVDPQSDIRFDRFDAAEEAFLAGASQQQISEVVQPTASSAPVSTGESVPSVPEPEV